jgi:hypothetical protein
MAEGNDPDYKALCAAFYSIVDNDAPIDQLVTETFMVNCETLKEGSYETNLHNDHPDEGLMPCEYKKEHCWTSLSVNIADVNNMQLPEEGIYEPK